MVRVDTWERAGVPLYDRLRLRNILVAAQVVVYRCVRNQLREGWVFPGQNQVVFVKVEGVDGTRAALLESFKGLSTVNVSKSNGTTQLGIVSGRAVLDTGLIGPNADEMALPETT